ncbi:MAG: DNA polymerase III subunit delta [Candidatus Zhuqueibacterota bacterium]
MNKTAAKIKSITYQQALTSLGKRELAPVYFIFGEEKYQHDQLIDKIIDVVVDPTNRDFNFDMFYANEAEIEKVINIARSYPMMAQRRLVILKDIQLLKPAAQKLLGDALLKPTPTTCLVLTSPQKSVTGKSLIAISNFALSVDCRQLYDNELIPWIEEHLRSKKIQIDTQAIPLLLAQVGSSLLNLTNELEKVLVNILPRTRISPDDVQKVTSISKQFNIFELCNAIGEKNFPAAINIVDKLLDQGENPSTMIIQISKHMVNLVKLASANRMGKTSTNEIAAMTRLAGFVINKMKSQFRKYSDEQLRRSFHHLAEADSHLKSSYQQPKLIIELLVYKIIKQ